jgi:hypothetical protein
MATLTAGASGASLYFKLARWFGSSDRVYSPVQRPGPGSQNLEWEEA